MKLWRHLFPRQQLKRVKQLGPMMIFIIFLTLWQFDWLPALLIMGLTIIGWTLGLQLAKLRVKYADMIKREN